jgi:pantothenate kinase
MDAQKLASDLKFRAGNANRYMVGIAGPPGAGKSTISSDLNDALKALGETSVVVPMDGYHFDDIVLNARGHRARKGAPHTFDATGFAVLLKRIKTCEPDIAIPVFDRTMELSRAAADVVDATTRFILVEGNYLLLKQSPWDQLKPLFDLTIFIDVPKQELERRLTGRILAHGHDAAFAKHWIASNDMLNVDTVTSESAKADITLSS